MCFLFSFEQTDAVTRSYPNGVTYEGALLNNNKHGLGTLTLPSGNVYIGMFQDDLRHGAGVLRYKDGSVYEGEWAGGKEHGQGKLTRPDGTVQQEGEFGEGKLFTGTGVIAYANGSTYEGRMLEGKHHGPGKITFSDGSTWQGEIVQGELRTGNGTRYFPSMRAYQTGQWLDGKLHGKGKIFRKMRRAEEVEESSQEKTTDTQDSTEMVIAEGEFELGVLINGFATNVPYTLQLTHQHVAKSCRGHYTGDFTGGLPHGKGSFVANDKSVSYVGKWVAGNLHGPEGREVRQDGTIYEGSFFAGNDLLMCS